MTTGTSGYSADSRLSSAMPSSTGIFRSVITVCTPAVIPPSASTPFAAVMTS